MMKLNKYYKKLDKHFRFDGFDDLYSKEFNLKKTIKTHQTSS